MLWCLLAATPSCGARLPRRATPCAPPPVQEWDIQQLCYEVDIEPYATTRDAAIGEAAKAAGVKVSPFVSHTLYVSTS